MQDAKTGRRWKLFLRSESVDRPRTGESRYGGTAGRGQAIGRQNEEVGGEIWWNDGANPALFGVSSG